VACVILICCSYCQVFIVANTAFFVYISLEAECIYTKLGRETGWGNSDLIKYSARCSGGLRKGPKNLTFMSTRSLQDFVINLEDIFMYISLETTDFDETWQRDWGWGQSDPVKFLARSL